MKAFSLPDLLVIGLLGTVIYGLVGMGQEWSADFNPVTEIDLSISALPRYVMLSAFRGLIAYGISLVFTLIVGYAAAYSSKAEWFLIPLLDVLQSIPVLGFLPGLVLGLIAVFPKTNLGLELATVLMIFTGQVWNMTFSFYYSLKSLPQELRDAAQMIGLSRKERLLRVELPYSALDLAWNSLMSMAGGWFFLSVCEAFTLGSLEFRLPGIGAYMAVAIAQGNRTAMAAGVGAMALLIVFMDFVIWRPVLAWVHRFRMDDAQSTQVMTPLVQLWIQESVILESLSALVKRIRLLWPRRTAAQKKLRARWTLLSHWWARNPWLIRGVRALLNLGVVGLVGYVCYELFFLGIQLTHLSQSFWILLVRNTLWTFLRVSLAVILGSLWAIPVGIWIALSPARLRVAQPVIQVLASFPAPMLYPLAISIFIKLGIGFDVGSMFLMMLGVQWYILFNVMAGALRISQELESALLLMRASRWDRWKRLYLPSVFPALVTGWITAAGGAWNASIVAEMVFYENRLMMTEGLGSMISRAAAARDFELLTASLIVMVGVVILLNRTLWAKLGHLAQNRFRSEGVHS